MIKGIFRKALPLLAAVALAGCARGEKTVEYPDVDFYTTETLDISKIELTDSTTVLHFSAVYIPGFWIRLDEGTHIVAGGEKLPCLRSDRLSLGEKFYIPENGRDTFSLTFPAVPKGTESIDFSEERSGDAFRMFGIDLTGRGRRLSLDSVPVDVLQTPDRNEGLPAVRLESGRTDLNVHFLGYHEGIGKEVHLYVNNLVKGQEQIDVRIDSTSCSASVSLDLDGPAEMVLTNPVYLDFMAAAGEILDIFVDLTAHSYDVRKKHFPEAVKDGERRPSVYFSGAYSALNYYLNNENCDDLPFGPFFAGEGIDYRWTDEEYADAVISRYRSFADSLSAVPAARSVKEYYAGGLKNSTIYAFANAAELRLASFWNEHGRSVPAPAFRPLDQSSLSRLSEVADINDSTLLSCMDALSLVQAKTRL